MVIIFKQMTKWQMIWVEDNVTMEGKYQWVKIRLPTKWLTRQLAECGGAFHDSLHFWCSLYCFHLELNVWPWVHDIFWAPVYWVVKGEGYVSGSLRPSLDVHFWLHSKSAECLAVKRQSPEPEHLVEKSGGRWAQRAWWLLGLSINTIL